MGIVPGMCEIFGLNSEDPACHVFREFFLGFWKTCQIMVGVENGNSRNDMFSDIRRRALRVSCSHVTGFRVG